MDYSALAAKSIRGECLSRLECKAVLDSDDSEILDLLAASYEVRRTFCGNKVHLHTLTNAKSGLCPEDCSYCSQSSISEADIAKYPMVPQAQLVNQAVQAKQAKSKRFCIVAAGRGPTQNEVEYLSSAVREIKRTVDIEICCSVGLLSEEKTRELKLAGVDRLNHNLNTSERFYPQICTTHTYQDRMATLRAARAAGLGLCCGVIVGMGESEDDIIDVFLALRELSPESIPVNFLHPIEGTPLQDVSYLTPNQCLRTLCLARFLNPKQEIRIAGGRELHLRSLQAMGLFPANSIFVDGYLTTPGQATEDAWQMLSDLGFEIEVA